MRKALLLLSMLTVLTPSYASGTTPGRSLGTVHKDWVCYTKEEHGTVLSMIQEGTECMKVLAEDKPTPWYQSPWLYGALGLIIGGSVTFGAMR